MFLIVLLAVLIFVSSASLFNFDSHRLNLGRSVTSLVTLVDGQLNRPVIGVRFLTPRAESILSNQTSASISLESLIWFQLDTTIESDISGEFEFHRSYRTRQYLVQQDGELIVATPSAVNETDPITFFRALARSATRNWEPLPGTNARGVLKLANLFPYNFSLIWSGDEDRPIIDWSNRSLSYCNSDPFVLPLDSTSGFTVRLGVSVVNGEDELNSHDHSEHVYRPSTFFAQVRIASSVDYIPIFSYTNFLSSVESQNAGLYDRSVRTRDFLSGGTIFRECNQALFPSLVYSLYPGLVHQHTLSAGLNLVLYPEDYLAMLPEGRCIARILPGTVEDMGPSGPTGIMGLNALQNVVGIFEPGHRIGFCEPY